MDQDLGFGGEVGGLDAGGGGVEEAGDVVVGRGGAEGPEQAGGDLVAERHDGEGMEALAKLLETASV